MMHGGGGMMDGGGGAVVLVVLVLLAVVAGAALMWIGQARRPVNGGERDRSRGELDRRYAAGELSRDEYLQRRRDIES